MQDIILHHYDRSSYSRKARHMLAFKGLSWKSVTIPDIMPKPDLMPLTGGYRLTPVMQIGANVYCDTDLIAAYLDVICPDPPLFSQGVDPADHSAMCFWANSFFHQEVRALSGTGMIPQAFVEDRNKVLPFYDIDEEEGRRMTPGFLSQIQARMNDLDRQLADGRPYIFGEAPLYADFSMFSKTVLFQEFPLFHSMLDELPHLNNWIHRLAQIQRGDGEPMDSKEALKVAAKAEPVIPTNDYIDPVGLKLGDRLRITPAEWGMCPSEGELVYLNVKEIAIKRTSDELGSLVQHFPRYNMDVELI